MKNHLNALILILLSFSFLSFHFKANNIDKYESTVVLNIKKHSSEDMQAAQSLLIKNNSINIDYQCLASGIIVFKVSHNYMNQTDIKQLVYSALNSKIPTSRINILFIDIHSISSKC